MEVFVFVLFVFGIAWFLLWSRQYFLGGYRTDKFLNGLFIGFGVVFVSLGLLSLLGALGAHLSTYDTPPCAWVLENVTVGDPSGPHVDYYTYTNTCATTSPPRIVEVIYTIYAWILFFIGLIGVLLVFYLLWRGVQWY